MCECVTKARGSILRVTQWPEGGHWLRGRLMRKGEREPSRTHRRLPSFGWVRDPPGLVGGLCAHALLCKCKLSSIPHNCGQTQVPRASQRGDYFLV